MSSRFSPSPGTGAAFICGFCLWLWCGWGGVGAQVSNSAPTALGEIEPVTAGNFPAGAADSVQQKLSEARANLAAAGALGDNALTGAPPGIPPHEVTTRRVLLQRLVRLLEQQLSNAAELELTVSRRAELLHQAQAWTRFEEPPPYSILVADRLREEIQEEKLKIAGNEGALRAIDQLVLEHRTALSAAEEKVRQLNEQLEIEAAPGLMARNSWQRELERLRSQVAAASMGVLDSELRLRQEALAQSRTRIDFLRRQLVTATSQVSFTQADLDAATARIEQDSQKLEQNLGQAHERSASALKNLDATRAEMRRLRERPDGGPADLARAAEEITVREAQLETAHRSIRTLRLMLECENVERSIWEMRFTATTRAGAQTLRDSRRQLQTVSRRLDLWKDYQQQQFDLASSQVELQEAHLQTLALDSGLLPLAREQLATLRERDEVLLRLLRKVGQIQRLNERWAEDLRTAEGRLPFFLRVAGLFLDARSFVEKLWTFELFTAEDTILVEGQKITGKRSITFGKITLAVFILGIGIVITRLLTRFVGSLMTRRMKIESNQTKLVLRWLQAFLVACLVMFSLSFVKIPLTVFAFAGGALAIGLGFGMQTLLKNFVSGLILLFERPFRVGDVLDINGQRGTVTEIGLRSSVLQLWDGTETLIPNSSLLENNVSNWTYSNRKVRFSVVVGVAYGTDTRRTIQALTEIAERHGLVEKDPKAQVLFTAFGESALTFELRYWVDVLKGNAALVGSDLRQMIATAFADSGIQLAFPQRDVHLDSRQPLSVEIVRARNDLPLASPPLQRQ